MVAAGVPDSEVPPSRGESSSASDVPNLKRQNNEESLVTAPKSPRISDVVPLRHGPGTGSGAPSASIFDVNPFADPVRRLVSRTVEQPSLYRRAAFEKVDRSGLDRSPRCSTPPLTFGPVRPRSPRHSPLTGTFMNAAQVPIPGSPTISPPGELATTRPVLPNGSVGLVSPSLQQQPSTTPAPLFVAITDAAMPMTPGSNAGAEAGASSSA